MSPIVPLTQDPDALFESSQTDELGRSTSFLESRLLRWLAATLMLALLACIMFFSGKGHYQSSTAMTNTTGALNGTELLVRAYKIPDPNITRTGQRSFSGTLQARYQ
ncbi:MAG: hypothetical protein ACK48K_10850, partial [Planctomycetota bacterium]